jgi:hypothetical protein
LQRSSAALIENESGDMSLQSPKQALRKWRDFSILGGFTHR